MERWEKRPPLIQFTRPRTSERLAGLCTQARRHPVFGKFALLVPPRQREDSWIWNWWQHSRSCLWSHQTGIEKSSSEDPLLLPDVDRGFSSGWSSCEIPLRSPRRIDLLRFLRYDPGFAGCDGGNGTPRERTHEPSRYHGSPSGTRWSADASAERLHSGSLRNSCRLRPGRNRRPASIVVLIERLDVTEVVVREGTRDLN